MTARTPVYLRALEALRSDAYGDPPSSINLTSAIKTLEPIHEFPTIRGLHLRMPTAPDLAPLESLALEWLSLDCKVGDGQLARLLQRSETLRALVVKKPALLTPDVGSTRIEDLDVPTPTVADLSFVARFPNLRRLSFGGDRCRVSTLTSLAALPHLEELEAHGVRAHSLEGLEQLHRLREVRVSGKSLTSIEALADHTALEHLDINLCPVASLRPLTGARSLLAVRMRGVPVDSLEDLFGLASLGALYAERTRVRSIEGIGTALRQLRLLWIGSTRVRDLEGLRGLDELLELELGALERITDFRVLTSLRSLKFVDLYGTRFDDLSILESMPNLRWARLTRTPIRADDPAVRALNQTLKARHGWRAGLSFDEQSESSRLHSSEVPYPDYRSEGPPL